MLQNEIMQRRLAITVVLGVDAFRALSFGSVPLVRLMIWIISVVTIAFGATHAAAYVQYCFESRRFLLWRLDGSAVTAIMFIVMSGAVQSHMGKARGR